MNKSVYRIRMQLFLRTLYILKLLTIEHYSVYGVLKSVETYRKRKL